MFFVRPVSLFLIFNIEQHVKQVMYHILYKLFILRFKIRNMEIGPI